MKKKKSPLARAEGCFFFFLFLLQGWVCLHIDLPFTPLPLSWYGFFGAALTSSLTLSHLDPLPTPEQQTQTADPRLASPSICFFLFFFTNAHCFAVKQLLRRVVILAVTGGALLFRCPLRLQYGFMYFLCGRSNFGWLRCRLDSIFVSVWPANPFQTLADWCQKMHCHSSKSKIVFLSLWEVDTVVIKGVLPRAGQGP